MKQEVSDKCMHLHNSHKTVELMPGANKLIPGYQLIKDIFIDNNSNSFQDTPTTFLI